MYDFLAPPQASGELGRLGPYRVLRVLGHGGMGVVFLAEDPQLRRQVALKAMLPSLAASPSSRQRFLREAQAAAAIEHDHIIAIHQVGEDRGVPFLAMPLLKGEPLNERLRRPGEDGKPELLALAETLRIGREIAEGLAAAHERGLIHRDIKPGNIWLEGARARVKILDFGLARSADGSGQLTQEGAIVGTPAYMAPEQATGKPVDERCDLFSLGCVLYLLCTRQAPFKGADTISTLLAVTSAQPPTPREVNAAIPPALSDLVMHLLAKNPAQRPPSARAVAEALQALAVDQTLLLDPSTTQRKLRPGKPVPAAAAPATGGRRWLLAGAILVLLGGAGGAAYYFATREPDTSPEERINQANKDGQHPDQSTGAGTAPLSRVALVSNPAPLPGVESWSIETRGHRGAIHATAFSPDGAWLATAGYDGVVRIWKAQDNSLARALLGHAGPVSSLTWSSDRQRAHLLSASDDGTVLLWDVMAGKLLRTFHVSGGKIYAAAWLDEQTVMAKISPPEDRIVFWDANTGKFQRSLKGALTDKLKAFRWSPDGRLLATGHAEGVVKVWEAASGKLRQTLKTGSSMPICLAWTPNSRTLAVGDTDKRVHIWNVVGGKGRPTIATEFRDPPHVLAWAPRGRALAAAGLMYDPVKIFRFAPGRRPQVLPKPRGRVLALGWAPEGQKLAGGHESGALFLWNVATGRSQAEALPSSRILPGPTAWSPDGQLLAGGQGAPALLWDLKAGTLRRFESPVFRSCAGLAWSPDGHKLALFLSRDQNLQVFDMATGKHVRTVDRKGNYVAALAWSSDSTRLASTAHYQNQKLLIHDPVTGRLLASSPDRQEVSGATVLAWSPTGKVLASNGRAGRAGGGKLLLWDVSTNPLRVRAIDGHRQNISALAWSPRGATLASGSDDFSIRLWNAGGESLAVLGRHQARINALRWLSEDRLLALDAAGTASVWDTQQLKRVRSMQGLPTSGELSPDGQTLAARLAEATRLWDLEDGKPGATLLLLRPANPPVWLALSASGHYRGPAGIESDLVHVVQTASGQETLSPAEFARKYQWKNEPERVRLTRK
jgi:WD40 repeat protein/serine/threonine protein kinase